MTTLISQVFDYVDSWSYRIENDEKAVAYIKAMPKRKTPIITYNQNDYTYSKAACTLECPLGMSSTLFNIRVSDAQEEAHFRFAQWLFWYKEGEWNSSNNGMISDVKWRNINQALNPEVWFADVLLTDLFQLAIDQWLGVQTTIRASAKFFAALRKGIIDTADGMTWNIGHCIALYSDDNGWYQFADTDYKASRGKLSRKTLMALRANGTFFQACRIILPLKKISTLTPEAYSAAMKLKAARSAARKLFAGNPIYQDQLHTENVWREKNLWQ